MDDRIHFIEHKGKSILLCDFSNATRSQMQLLLEHLRITVAQHGHESLLTFGDFAGAEIDKTVATRMKEVLTLDRPFVKRTAWIGTEKIPHALMEGFHTFSQRNIATFKTREEALDWLVTE
jgi:hypothetical protein